MQEARPDPPELTSPQPPQATRLRARVACALALAALCALARGATYPKPQAATAGKGRLEYVQGIPVLHLAGTPAEMGEQQGRLVGQQFRVLRTAYLNRFLGGEVQQQAAKLAAMGFEQHMPPPYVAELKAMATASGQPYVDALLANTFLDSARVVFCSAVIAQGEATAGGRLLFARNLDFFTLGIAHKASLLTVYHHAAPGVHSFVSVSWPGLVGVLSGMNDAGLCVAELISVSIPGVKPGMPYCMMHRRILETCTTPQEALALVRATARTSANNLAVAGPNGEPLVIEFTADAVAARKPELGVVLATNHFRSPALVAEPRPIDGRYATLVRMAAEAHGKIDAAALQRMLLGCQQEGITIQSMIFEPAERRLQLSIGSRAAASGRYVTLDCTRLLAGK